jgi:hypothetical protein
VRTTVTLDPDTDAMVRRLMRERGLTFKQALNEAIRSGARPPRKRRVTTPTFAMGRPSVPLEKALRIAGELEDEELVRKLAVRK